MRYVIGGFCGCCDMSDTVFGLRKCFGKRWRARLNGNEAASNEHRATLQEEVDPWPITKAGLAGTFSLRGFRLLSNLKYERKR